MEHLAAIRKALVAAVGAAAAACGAAMLDGDLTTREGIASAGAGLVVGFAAWAVPNRPTQL
jgi:hypothetical protein